MTAKSGRGDNLRTIAFMNFSRDNLAIISERMKQMTVCFAGEKEKPSSSIVRRDV